LIVIFTFYVLFKLNRTADAKAAFEAAKAIEDNNVIKNNLGVITFNEGDLAKAEELFTAAIGAGDQVNYNLGIIKIIQGKYADAINYFGSESEVNAGLAKLLNKENDAALTCSLLLFVVTIMVGLGASNL